MAYRRIILHAGLSKTGSTSIQAACERHRSLLAQHSVVYPAFVWRQHQFENHGVPLILATSDRPGQYALGLRQRFGDNHSELRADCAAMLSDVLAAEGDTLVLSSERVAGMSRADQEAVRDILRANAERLSVLLYLRSPFELLEGILQERAKAGATVDALEVSGRSKQRYLQLQEVFTDSLQVVNYHKATQDPGGLVAGFLRYCGIPSAELEEFRFAQRNQRISQEAFLLMTAVNRAYPRREAAQHGVDREAGDLQALHGLPGQKFCFPWKPGEEVYESCLDEYRWFRRELGQEFPSPPQAARQALWGDDTLNALPAALNEVQSLPIRKFLTQYLRENGIKP